MIRQSRWLLMPAMLVFGGKAAGIEKPGFELLAQDGRFELRQYEAIPVASTPLDGMGGRNGSFNKLFRYISGDNDQEKKIAMTSPVFMEDDPADAGDGKAGAMSFMLPAKVAADGAPQPTGEAVALRKIDGGKVAVLRFKGWTNEKLRQQAIADLREWVKGKGWEAQGEPFFAFYDPPWTPEMLRRNEVWLRVK